MDANMTAHNDLDIVLRWERAAARAREEQVRVIRLGDQYFATSSSNPLGSYRLEHSADGWGCECKANAEHRVPCKHLWALAEALDLDVLRDMRLTWPVAGETLAA